METKLITENPKPYSPMLLSIRPDFSDEQNPLLQIQISHAGIEGDVSYCTDEGIILNRDRARLLHAAIGAFLGK